MRKNVRYLAIIVIAVLVGFACEKSDIDEVATEEKMPAIQKVELVSNENNDLITVEEDRFQVLTSFSDILNQEVEEVTGIDLLEIDFLDEILDDLLKSGDNNTCPAVDIQLLNEPENFPRIITKVFEEGCTNSLGKVMSGVMVVYVNDRYNVVGSKREITYKSLAIGGNIYNGQKEIVYEGENDNGEKVFKHKGALRIENENGKVVYRMINQSNYNTLVRDTSSTIVERISRITGQVHVVKSSGIAYRMKIDGSTPLVRSSECTWPISGIKEFTFFENPEEIQAQFAEYEEDFGMNDIQVLRFKKDYEVEVDFGDEDSSCDNLVVKTIDGGEPEEITLKWGN